MTDKSLLELATGLNHFVEYLKPLASLDEREISAKRKRKLRKRGESTKFSHNTANGKARYLWMKATWDLSTQGAKQ